MPAVVFGPFDNRNPQESSYDTLSFDLSWERGGGGGMAVPL